MPFHTLKGFIFLYFLNNFEENRLVIILLIEIESNSAPIYLRNGLSKGLLQSYNKNIANEIVDKIKKNYFILFTDFFQKMSELSKK